MKRFKPCIVLILSSTVVTTYTTCCKIKEKQLKRNDEMSALYCEISTKLLNTIHRQNKIFCNKLGGIFGYDSASLYHFVTECICYMVKF